jgi:molecular chaperone HtpG
MVNYLISGWQKTIMQKGKVSVSTENIFPIIKKFLYTDHEIFLRELVSNAVDASQKIKYLSSKGEFKGELGELKIKVSIDEKKNTLTISDSGIGMTADEIDKYINQIAFSGAEEFVEKFKDEKDTTNIIGHFGLGFYSAFMVADKVEINTLSYKEGAEPAKWECRGTTDFVIKKGKRKNRGTDIVLHINEESKEFLEAYRIKSLLNKYCKFLPVEIEFDKEVINTTDPLWKKNPSELQDEDYINFYQDLYPLSEKPLFWIHINVDYPFNLTGVLYFPKIDKSVDPNRNKISLYSNQVYVTDNVSDIVPEYLMLLHGVIDSPDIPLNVSRSSLQSDGQVKKITQHISKKVTDKLSEIFKKDRKDYEEKWKGIGLFVKYGMISDEKFYDRAEKIALLQDTKSNFHTLEEYKTILEVNQVDKDNKKVALYTTDPEAQHTYIERADKQGYGVVLMDDVLDNHFLQHLEHKLEDISFKRVDSDTLDKLIDKDEKHESLLDAESIKVLDSSFNSVMPSEQFKLKVSALSPSDHFVSVIRNEYDRRMKEMNQMGPNAAIFGSMPDNYEVVVNSNHPAASRIAGVDNEEERSSLVQQSFDLAMLSSGMLKGEALSKFVERSMEMIGK